MNIVELHNFATEYLELYRKSESDERAVLTGFADRCFSLGIEMDCGNSLEAAYPGLSLQNLDYFKRIVKEIVDVDMLASAIFSKYRYITHWSYNESLTDEDNREWFIVAFEQLVKITNQEAQMESGCKLECIKGDITKIDSVEAIVNAANNSLLGGGGVDGAIHRAAGKELLEECRTLHGCQTGEAKITKAYKLPCKNIIHTVGPVWNGGKSGEAGLLADCYSNSMELARQYGIRSLAFPSISTGVYSYPIEQAAQIAVQTVRNYVEAHEGVFEKIVWVLFDDRTYRAYEKQINSIKQ